MKNNLIDEIVKNIPLKTRLSVSTELAFINLITELGYRESKMWADDEDPLLSKLCKLAEELSTDHIEEFKQWEKDGKPT